MARYNRDFLVPYLFDVCSIELLLKKVRTQKDHAQEQAWRCENQLSYDTMPQPPIEPYAMQRREGEHLLGCGTICIIAVIIFLFLDVGVLAVLGILAAIGCFVLGASQNEQDEFAIKKYEKNKSVYENALWQYRMREPEREQTKKNLVVWNQKVQYYGKYLSEVSKIRDRVYSVNIIARNYRNEYAAYYLYDWFSSSQSDDLDMALQMFVLEEIKARLDRVIANQTEILLNQRIQLALQRQSLEQQQRHSEMMRTKLNQINASNEERNTYLKMIESNTATTAYFAVADYIRKL